MWWRIFDPAPLVREDYPARMVRHYEEWRFAPEPIALHQAHFHAWKKHKISLQKKDYYGRKKAEILTRSRTWREKNPDRCQENSRRWAQENSERAAELRRESYDRHRERRLANAAKRWEELNDASVRAVVAHGRGAIGLTSKDVPDEVLPLFRTQLLINRELRKQKAAP
jgi:hypothetical protein